MCRYCKTHLLCFPFQLYRILLWLKNKYTAYVYQNFVTDCSIIHYLNHHVILINAILIHTNVSSKAVSVKLLYLLKLVFMTVFPQQLWPICFWMMSCEFHLDWIDFGGLQAKGQCHCDLTLVSLSSVLNLTHACKLQFHWWWRHTTTMQ